MCVKADELAHWQTETDSLAERSFSLCIPIIRSKRCDATGKEFIFGVRPNCACKAILKNLGEKEFL